MHVGQSGTIVGVYVDQPLRSRMTSMGFNKGSNITIQRKNWFGHVFHIVIDQLTNLVIRKVDASNIWVRVEIPVDTNDEI